MERTEIERQLKARGHDLKSASRLMGRNAAFLQQYIRYHKPKRLSESDRESLAELLGMTPDDLREGPAPAARRAPRPQLPDQLPSYTGELVPGRIEIGKTDFIAIGRYDAALSAGPGAILDPNAEPLGYGLIEAQWLAAVTRSAPEFLALLRVDNDSMETTLFEDDWILVDKTQRNLRRTGIYGIQVEDTAWVKRVEVNLENKRISLISDNPRYPMRELSEDEVAPIGRALCVVARKL